MENQERESVASRLRRVLAAIVLVCSSAVAPSAAVWTDVDRPGRTATVLVLNALVYAALLLKVARHGRGTRAALVGAVGSLSAGLVPATSFHTAGVVVAVFGWMCAYVFAWSYARRTGIGIIGVVVTVATMFGAAYGWLAIAFVYGLSEGSDSPLSHADLYTAMLALTSIVLGLSNGSILLEESARSRFDRHRATVDS